MRCRLAVLPSLIIAATAWGQSVDERRQIDAFRDTLQMVTDTMALRERQALMLRAASRSRSEPFYHLYLGTLSLRQGELGGTPHLDEAAAEFRWAARLAPTWTYAWFGVGTAELALGAGLAAGEADAPRRGFLAQEAYSRGAQALARAVSLEPQLAGRLESLARRAIRDGFWDRALAIRDGLNAGSAKSRAPRRLLALGRVQRELGDSGALATFADYLQGGGNRALAQLELGRTQLSLGDLSGAMRYFAAGSTNDSTTIAELRSDLALVASDADLAEFDRRAGALRADFVRRFWTGRDRLGLRPDGARLAEHFRRLMVARSRYLIFGEDGVERFDDRGRVFIRQGDPDERVTLAAPGVEPNESWCYRRGPKGGGTLVLHFVARHNPRDFRLIESVWDIATGRSGTSSGAALPPGPGRAELVRSRAPLDPVYRDVPTRPGQLGELQVRERALGHRSMILALGSDAFPFHFATEVNLWGQVLVMGGTGASPVLQLVVLAPRTGAPAARVARIRLVALDTAGQVVASADTNMVLDSSSTGRLTIPVRSGRLITHAVLQLGQAGSDLGIDTLRVPAPGSRELGLGGLLVGSEDGSEDGSVALPLASGGEFRLAANGRISRNGILKLGAEVFGLTMSGKAAMRVLVSPDSESGASGKWRPLRLNAADRIVARDQGRGPIAMWRASIPLRELVPGQYRIAVIATAGSGQTARQEGRLEVGQQ